MRRLSRSLVPLLLLTLPPALAAQRGAAPDAPPPRQGLWLAAGGGIGREDESCTGCTTMSRQTGTVAYLAFGGTLSSSVRLGADLTAWRKSTTVGDEYTGTLTAVALLYPFGTSGFHFKAGAGLAGISLEPSSFASASGTGPGGIVGMGYDLSLGRRVAITPTIGWMKGWTGDITQEGSVIAEKTSFDVVMVTVGLTFQ